MMKPSCWNCQYRSWVWCLHNPYYWMSVEELKEERECGKFLAHFDGEIIIKVLDTNKVTNNNRLYKKETFIRSDEEFIKLMQEAFEKTIGVEKCKH